MRLIVVLPRYITGLEIQKRISSKSHKSQPFFAKSQKRLNSQKWLKNLFIASHSLDIPSSLQAILNF